MASHPRQYHGCSSSFRRASSWLWCFLFSLIVGPVAGFAPTVQQKNRRRDSIRILLQHANKHNPDDDSPSESSAAAISRDAFLSQGGVIGALILGTTTTVSSDPAAAAEEQEPSTSSSSSSSATTTMFQLPSGIRYLELQPGTGPTPKYGQLCSIAYKGYIKLPANKNNANPQPQQFDQATSYLLKHGSGRTIAGLDEGLHTLRVGGSRRIVIPPKLGYVTSGLGPIPEYPWDRARLNTLLDQMIQYRGGTVVFEVTLLSAMDDEADQGYYDDGSLTPEQFEQLRLNIQQKAQQAANEAAAATL